MSARPRIGFLDLDNLQNNYFNMARCAYEAGLGARVLLPAENSLPGEHRMTWNAAGAPSTDPPWVDRVDACPLTPSGFRLSLARRLLARVRQYDALFCSGQGAFWGAWSGRPFGFVSYGADLDQLAFQGWSGDPADHDHDSFLRTVAFRLRGLLYRRAIRGSALSIIAPYQWDAAQRVGLRNLRWFNHVIDMEVLKPLKGPDRFAQRAELGWSNDEIVIFIPSRLNWTRPSVADHKGTDVLLRAVAEIARTEPRLRLVLVRKGWDITATEALVRDLDLTGRTRWLDPMPKPALARLYSASDLVLDQFGSGILALVAVEALACGAPVLTRVPARTPAPFYEEAPPPIFVATERDLVERMKGLVAEASRREELGEQGVAWIRRNCSPEAVARQIERIAMEVAAAR